MVRNIDAGKPPHLETGRDPRAWVDDRSFRSGAGLYVPGYPDSSSTGAGRNLRCFHATNILLCVDHITQHPLQKPTRFCMPSSGQGSWQAVRPGGFPTLWKINYHKEPEAGDLSSNQHGINFLHFRDPWSGASTKHDSCQRANQPYIYNILFALALLYRLLLIQK